jgi:excisionase family DNA binding protein
MAMDVRDLLTEQQAAERLDIDPATLRRWLQEGRLPYYRLGGRRIRIAPADIDIFIQQSRVCAGTDNAA